MKLKAYWDVNFALEEILMDVEKLSWEIRAAQYLLDKYYSKVEYQMDIMDYVDFQEMYYLKGGNENEKALSNAERQKQKSI